MIWSSQKRKIFYRSATPDHSNYAGGHYSFRYTHFVNGFVCLLNEQHLEKLHIPNETG